MEDYNWIWQTVLIFIVGRSLLRIGGRKSISQMTITQVIVMVGIGSLLIQPIAGRSLLQTFGVALLIVIMMIVTEYLEMKFDILETISTGKALIVIEDGIINVKNLRKLRMSVDRLETRLRQSGISSIKDVKYASIEVSGQLGYELFDNLKPATNEDFKLLLSEVVKLKEALGIKTDSLNIKNQMDSIFSEIIAKETEGRKEP